MLTPHFYTVTPTFHFYLNSFQMVVNRFFGFQYFRLKLYEYAVFLQACQELDRLSLIAIRTFLMIIFSLKMDY